jgi:uncharacterized protein YbjT (DUF2867 family)
MRLLVAGGTGTAGRAVVAEAVARGHEVRVLTRGDVVRPQPADAGAAPGGGAPGGAAPGGATLVRGDLVSGSGLTAALEGVEVVVDVSNVVTTSRRRAEEFFTTGTAHLAAAAGRAGVRHHVLLSIVGIDGSRLGYYRAKVAQEQRLATAAGAAGVGHTVARTTQFHDFALQTLERSSLRRLVLVPSVQVQPVDTREVAAHLLTLAEAQPVGRAPDLAGPRVERLPDLVRRVAERRGARAWVVGVPVPAGLRTAQLPRGGIRGTRPFADWLATLPQGSAAR